MARWPTDLVGLGALLVVLAGCTSDASPAGADPTPEASWEPSTAGSSATASVAGSPVGGLVFGECGDQVDVSSGQLSAGRSQRLTFECGYLDVPLDHDSPDGEQISMQVVRIRDARQHDRIGSLVMNPGGPGNAGHVWAPYWAASLPETILERFDVVTFDPRGTGYSEGINCPDPPEADEPGLSVDLTDVAAYEANAERLLANSRACATYLGTDRAPHYNTTATARDLDLLREALGDERLSYLGFSYGARLGAVYAHLFPHLVRAAVLDAPTDPEVDWLDANVRQVAAFERSLSAWADDCPNRESCARLGDPREALAALVRRADAMPIPSGRPVDDVPMSGADVLFAVVTLLYSAVDWPWLDTALGEALLGDSGSLQEAVDRTTGRAHDDTDPDASEALVAINCNDAAPGPSRREVVAAARRMAARAPTFAPMAEQWLMVCKYWDVERHALDLPTAPDAPPLLVVGTRGDPATPYPGAISLARVLGSGHLLTWDGEGHTAYLRSACIGKFVDAYLVDLVVPLAGTSCPAGG